MKKIVNKISLHDALHQVKDTTFNKREFCQINSSADLDTVISFLRKEIPSHNISILILRVARK